MQRDAIHKKKRTPNISANSSIHVHMQGYIKHETTLLHQTKSLSGLTSGLSVYPKWMPRKISKTRPSMNDISLTYSTYLLLLNIQGLPEPDIFPILIGLDDISDLRLFHWALFISRTFSIYDTLRRGNLHVREIVTALLLWNLAPTSFIQCILILVMGTDFCFYGAKVFSISHLNLLTPWQ